MKCNECGINVVKIDTCNGRMVCNADLVPYWLSKNPNTSILTPNGETIYCVLKGKSDKAHGIGYTLHTCFQSTSGPIIAKTKSCKVCGCKMVWENPHLPGLFHESSCNLENWDICHDCMVEHCTTTNCLECKLGKYPDCQFLEMKQHYMDEGV